MKTIGLVGGISWVSTVEYYRGIHQTILQRDADGHMPVCVVYSLDFARVRESFAQKNWHELLRQLVVASDNLERTGAEGLALCSNTSHIVAERLREHIRIPLIGITDATVRALKASRISHAALLGTRLTMESGFFTAALETAGIACTVPLPEERDFLDRSVFGELTKGIFTNETRARYVEIISSLADRGVNGVILGCTEMPLLVKQEHSPLPLFDTTAIHVESVVDFILG